jgi:hypothetical protein
MAQILALLFATAVIVAAISPAAYAIASLA